MFYWIMMALALVFWGSIVGYISTYLDKINNPYPSARYIGAMKKFLKRIKSLPASDIPISIGSEKFIRPVNRDIIMISREVKIFFTEDEAKMLTIHLLNMYPEMGFSSETEMEDKAQTCLTKEPSTNS